MDAIKVGDAIFKTIDKIKKNPFCLQRVQSYDAPNI
jgi:hypothetical protein